MTGRREESPATLTVAHVIHCLGAGGAETVLVELARAAPSAGLRLIVVALSDPDPDARVDERAPMLRALGATVYEMHAARYDIGAAAKLAAILRDERVDIVHTHLKHADVVGGIAARMAKVPSVSTLHVIEVPRSLPHRLQVKTAVHARRRLSHTVIAVSHAQRRWYLEYAGDDAPIRVVPNGVFEPCVVRDRAAVRAELGVGDDEVLALCVSLMRPEKGHADLLAAIRALPDGLRLVTALAGDGPLAQQFSAEIESDPVLRARTRMLGFRSDVADLFAAADFVIQPSLEDALPTTLISALAAGRPIVATDVGGIPDIVTPECGVLVAPNRPSALAAAMREMATAIRDDHPGVAAMRLCARTRFEDNFSAETWAKNLRGVYEDAIRDRPGRRRATDRFGARRRRIALVEFPPSGGLFQFSIQLGEALARAGDDVELITGPSPELTSREPDCRVRSILPTWHPTAGADAPDWWRRARRGIRAGQHAAAWVALIVYLLASRPDAVVWSAWRFPLDGWGVRIVRKVLPGAVLALVAHEPRPLVEQPGQDGLYKTSAITNGALSRAYADLDVAFVLGESARQTLIDTWRLGAPVVVIPHGDEGIYASSTIAEAKSTEPVALSFGTITAYKGIDTLCEAWPAVRRSVPNARLVIAGALSADVDERALRAQVDGLDGVTLRTGYVPVGDVAPFFAAARCVVLPYKRSSQSGVAHLAHTLGRPVVATRVGDIPDVVRDGVSGLLVAPGDAGELAGALVRLLTGPAEAQRMGEAGANALTDSASWDDVAARLAAGLDLARPGRDTARAGQLATDR